MGIMIICGLCLIAAILWIGLLWELQTGKIVLNRMIDKLAAGNDPSEDAEVEHLKAIFRKLKEDQARDGDTMDKLEEYRRDFR